MGGDPPIEPGLAFQTNGATSVSTEEYVLEHRLVDVCLTELKVSGTIVIQNGCVKLTDRGKRLAGFSRYFRNNLLSKHCLLMGKYSDDLTDTFNHGVSNRNYCCDGMMNQSLKRYILDCSNQ
jgi:hypothetical protein